METVKFPENLRSPIFDAFCNSVDRQYIYICDVKTNIWRWSQAAVDYFGLPSDTIHNLPSIWMDKVHVEDQERLAATFEELFSGRAAEHSCEYRVCNSKGYYVWVLCRGCMVYNEQGDMDICAGILTDLGQNNKFDTLTGLFSMHEFRSVLRDLVSPSNNSFGLLLIGLDDFRRLNEYGNYAFGNQILHQYAKKLSEHTEATLFRMDGDKFLLLCPNATERTLRDQFAQMAELAQNGVYADGELVRFSITGGGVLYPQHGACTDALYSNLELSLEHAKTQNREGFTMFSEQLQQEATELFRLRQRLKESIENQYEGFYLCYQPTVTPDSEHRLVGAEALLRWFHPDFGLVSPTTFIPVLEDSGRILQVGKWVLSTALRQVKEWLAYYPTMKISVNVSMLQLADSSFAQFVLREIQIHDFPKEQLILELTESCNVIHPDKIQTQLNFFREHGIQIALDDFGTGYASLSVLRDLTADWIKVDHSFVAQIAHNDFDQALTEALINLCRRLKLNVCVEGIENSEILGVIQQYSPTMMQGYLFSRPLDTKHFEEQYILGARAQTPGTDA